MLENEKVVLFEEDVYEVTPRGTDELNSAATSLASPEIELLVQIDGQSTVAEIKARVSTLAPEIVSALFKELSSRNYIRVSNTSNALDFVEFFNTKSAAPTEGAIDGAKAESESGTATLEKHGFYVRIARRGAERKVVEGHPISVLVVDDEPYLIKFLKQLLTLEGYETRVATNRTEIIAELTHLPLPDLVLLDVTMPDADGFDILLKMRRHRDLKNVPVVMLTAKATRAAVAHGLASGADGYITKPVEPDVLLKAIKSVLGLSADAAGSPKP